jgi:hypothetical protein
VETPAGAGISTGWSSGRLGGELVDDRGQVLPQGHVEEAAVGHLQARQLADDRREREVVEGPFDLAAKPGDDLVEPLELLHGLERRAVAEEPAERQGQAAEHDAGGEPKNASTVAPSAVASANTVKTDGSVLPRSIWLTMLGDSPTRRASSDMVIPSSLRRYASASRIASNWRSTSSDNVSPPTGSSCSLSVFARLE